MNTINILLQPFGVCQKLKARVSTQLKPISDIFLCGVSLSAAPNSLIVLLLPNPTHETVNTFLMFLLL
jgi:hypothetical protein